MKNLSRKKFFVPVLLFLSISVIMLITGVIMKTHYDNMERKLVEQQAGVMSVEPATALMTEEATTAGSVKSEEKETSEVSTERPSDSDSADKDADTSTASKMKHISFKDTSEASPAAFGDAIAFTAYDSNGKQFSAEIVFNDIIWEDDDKGFVKKTIKAVNDSGIWFSSQHSTSKSKFAVLKFFVILPEGDADKFLFKGNVKPNIEVKKNGPNLARFRTVYDGNTIHHSGDVIDMTGVFEYDGSKDLYFTFDFNSSNGYEVGYVKK